MTSLALLANATATSDPQDWPGGAGVFTVCGNLVGAVVKLQFLGPDDATWLDAGAECSFKAGGAGIFELPAVSIRAHVGPRTVNGGAPVGVFASADSL